jgi:hypothetical protein
MGGDKQGIVITAVLVLAMLSGLPAAVRVQALDCSILAGDGNPVLLGARCYGFEPAR